MRSPGAVAARLARLTEAQLATGMCLGVVLVVLLSLATATVLKEWELLRTSRVPAAYPPLIYSLMPSPGTSPVPGAPGAAGADFSQVYTSALALRHGESAYFPATREFRDRFDRPSGYPPLTNWVYTPLTLLSYYRAYVTHVVGSLLLLLATTAFVLWRTGLARHIPAVLLAQSSLYLLTPIGLAHMERGQFDLYVAVAAALCMANVFLERDALAVAAACGFVGALKWTSVPFLVCFSLAGAALSSRSRRLRFLLMPAVLAVATAAFWPSVSEYWTTIRFFEIGAPPHGITFTHLLPPLAAKLLPGGLTLAVTVAALLAAGRSESRRARVLEVVSAPLAMLLMILTICYTSISYEYHTVTLLGVLPGLVIWLERATVEPRGLKLATAATFGLMLCVSFRTFQLAPPFDAVAMTLSYAAFALVFLGLAGQAVLLASRPDGAHPAVHPPLARP